EYVKTLSADELRRIRGVVSIVSVGDGRLYIPRGTMGADFLHVLIPFGDYDSINDLLEVAAHLHGIKYNNFLADGTTDHVSFLDEFHYARLYRAGDGHLLALKDAVEHNRRNVNGVYRVKATIDGARAVAHVQEMVGWGVETRLRDQVADTCARLGLSWERERIAQLEVIGDGTRLHFARKLGPWR